MPIVAFDLSPTQRLGVKPLSAFLSLHETCRFFGNLFNPQKGLLIIAPDNSAVLLRFLEAAELVEYGFGTVEWLPAGPKFNRGSEVISYIAPLTDVLNMPTTPSETSEGMVN